MENWLTVEYDSLMMLQQYACCFHHVIAKTSHIFRKTHSRWHFALQKLIILDKQGSQKLMVFSVDILNSRWAKIGSDVMNELINNFAIKIVQMERKAFVFFLTPLKCDREKSSINGHFLIKKIFSGRGTADTDKISDWAKESELLLNSSRGDLSIDVREHCCQLFYF